MLHGVRCWCKGWNADSALAMGRRVCEALEGQDLPHAQAPGGQLTVSIGVAAWTPKPGESAVQLLRAADAALYRAKQLGRWMADRRQTSRLISR